MLPKLLVAVLFCGIVVSLGSALVMMMKGRTETDRHRMARALTLRVGLSVGLFVLLFILFALGVIRPHGLQG